VSILIGAAAVLLLIVAVAGTRPSAYHVERKLELAAPADRVFGVLDDLRRFAGVLVLFGEPLDKRDPDMDKTFGGPAAGVGQSYAWSGKEAGRGKMTIEESVPGQRVVVKIVFEKPMASIATCTLTLAGTPTGTLVTWSWDGDHNFIGKVFGLFMNMDKMLGRDIDKGLAQLKLVAT